MNANPPAHPLHRKTAANTHRLPSISVAAGGLILSLAAAGCTTVGYERADNSAAIASKLQTDIEIADNAVDRGISALERILEPNEAERKSALESYLIEAEAIEASWEKVRETTNDLRAETDAYLSGWADEIAAISDGDKREIARQRRDEILKTASEMRQQFDATTKVLNAGLVEVADLRLMLENDFTDAGIQAAQGFIRETINGGMRSKRSLRKYSREVAQVTAQLNGNL